MPEGQADEEAEPHTLLPNLILPTSKYGFVVVPSGWLAALWPLPGSRPPTVTPTMLSIPVTIQPRFWSIFIIIEKAILWRWLELQPD